MIYNVIGVMSGSSLDGLDIAFCEIVDARNDWSFQILHSTCIPFNEEWKQKLTNLSQMSLPEFLETDVQFGKFIGTEINNFIEQNELYHKVHFIGSHGHTAYHNPAKNVSKQIGDGATIAATTGITTISDLRNMDVALNGQGAPIVPMTDKLLFSEYNFCLNIGGIANITVNGAAPIAFDICPANQLLNHYALKAGQDFDNNGALAKNGQVDTTTLQALNEIAYYQQTGAKSLDNNFVQQLINIIDANNLSTENALATAVAHIAFQIAEVIKANVTTDDSKLIITGGGAYNQTLVAAIHQELMMANVAVVIPDEQTIEFKEALAMALQGTLRWREENTVFASVTGADRDSVGGAMWLGNQ